MKQILTLLDVLDDYKDCLLMRGNTDKDLMKAILNLEKELKVTPACSAEFYRV